MKLQIREETEDYKGSDEEISVFIRGGLWLDKAGIAATELPFRVHIGLKLAGPLSAAI
jgi:hypothetical protein